MELFSERGYEQTTVADIATRAGLTERTFFRHFSDKREVLFPVGTGFREPFVDAIAAAPADATPLQAVMLAVDAAATALERETGRERAAARQRIILANPELRERELSTMSDVGAAIAAAQRGRGVEEPTASLTAELGIAAFRVAFERWVADGANLSLSALIDESVSGIAAAVG
jgi:AcrR family transcriptional regulator